MIQSTSGDTCSEKIMALTCTVTDRGGRSHFTRHARNAYARPRDAHATPTNRETPWICHPSPASPNLEIGSEQRIAIRKNAGNRRLLFQAARRYSVGGIR